MDAMTDTPDWSTPDYPLVPPWSFTETLRRERASLGCYVSGHPLDRYGEDLGRAVRGLSSTRAIAGLAPLSRTAVAGMVEQYEERVFREGGRRVTFVLEDQVGQCLVRVPTRRIELTSPFLAGATEPVLVRGSVTFPAAEDEAAEPDPYLVLDEVLDLAEAIRQEARHVAVRVSAARCDRAHLVALDRALRRHPGEAAVRLILQLEDGTEAILVLPDGLRVEASRAFVEEVEGIFLGAARIM
jgi:DNA polymerase-3 subunit alpha